MTPELRHELDQLLSALCDGDASPEQIDRLEGLLRSDPECRLFYLRYVDMHSRLMQHPSLWQRLAEENIPTFPPGAIAPPPADSPVSLLGFLRDVGQQGWGFLSDHTMLFSVLGAILLAGATAIIVSGRGNKETTVGIRSETSKHSQMPVAQRPSPSPFVARLTAADCQWVDPESAIGEGALLIAGQKLELASGHVHIVFQSGAEVKLHGPAIFEIQSANSSFLTIGRLSARAATPESHGFTVHSRTAATVDLGTEFNVIASDDGHSQIGVVEGSVEVQLANGRQCRRLGVGESIEVEPGMPSVIARIEPGDGTPAFKFPTIEPPSNKDYADASQGHAHISVLRGKPQLTSASGLGSGPVEVLLDGKGQSNADAPPESFFFANNSSGLILLDLGKTIPVKKVNTYSWHKSREAPQKHVRAVQKYYLYGSNRATPPGADGNLAAAGWTFIAQVNTDEFFGFPQWEARPAQQAVSITAANGGPIGEFRYLLWDVRPTVSEAASHASDNTLYGEFDVYRAGGARD